MTPSLCPLLQAYPEPFQLYCAFSVVQETQASGSSCSEDVWMKAGSGRAILPVWSLTKCRGGSLETLWRSL